VKRDARRYAVESRSTAMLKWIGGRVFLEEIETGLCSAEWNCRIFTLADARDGDCYALKVGCGQTCCTERFFGFDAVYRMV